MLGKLFGEESGQAMTEYALVFAVLAAAIAGLALAWKLPLAEYFDRIAQALVKTR